MKIDKKTNTQTKAALKDVITNMSVVDAKAQAKKYRYKENLITGTEDFKKNNQFGWFRKLLLTPTVKIAEKGENAFALPNKEKNFVFVSKKVNKHVLAHEIGHTKDFKVNKFNPFLDTGLIGAISGRTLKLEKRAWDAAPGRNTEERQKVREYALGTYEKAQNVTRIGAGVAVAGTGLYLGRKPLLNAVQPVGKFLRRLG
jgi:hypothetical protein